MANKEFDNVQMDVTFTEATSHDDNIVSGENIAISLGKLAKWKTDLHKIVWSGSYNDLSNKPTIPTVNNGKLTIQKNGTSVGEFTANQSGNTTANIIVPTTPSDIGAAPESHTHTKSQITDFPASLKNPNSLTVQGNGTTSFTYDGSAAKTLNIKPGTGISVSSDTSGNITITNTSTNTDTKVAQNNSTADSALRVLLSKSANDTNETDVSYKSSKLTFNPSTGTLAATTFSGALSGNASTATKLATARTIALSGSVTGSASFDGSGNITIATTTNHTHSYLPLSGGTLSGNLNFSNSNGAITWNSATYQQRIQTVDDSTADTNVFVFQQSSDSGSSWVDLMSVQDNGNVVATTFTGNLVGNADTATALTSSAGSATQPVYFSSGKPVACTYTLGKSVPSNAVFTDTKVTAVGNHYTPSGGTTTSASGGTLTDITNSTSGVQVVTGVTKDAAGHVTGVTSVALKSVNTDHITSIKETTGSGNAITNVEADSDGKLSLVKGSTFSLIGHTHTSPDIKPILSKTFTDVIATANNIDNATFYFGKLIPDSWTDAVHIRYRVKVYCPSNTNYYQYADVNYYGRGATFTYMLENLIYNGSYRPAYYHNLYRLTSTGYNSGYGHLIGESLYGSSNSTSSSYKRTFEIDILEVNGGTFEFFDNMTLYANAPGTGSTNYAGRTDYNFTSSGLLPDANTISQLRYDSRVYAGSNGIKQYGLIYRNPDDKYDSLTTTNGTGTSKAWYTSAKISYPPCIFYYSGSSNVSPNALFRSTATYPVLVLDMQYSDNITSSAGYTINKSLYLECDWNEEGYFTISGRPYKQTFTAGKYYIFLGWVYTKVYQLSLQVDHPVYFYDGEKLIAFEEHRYALKEHNHEFADITTPAADIRTALNLSHTIISGSQTTTSSADGGSNVYTFTDSEGTTSTFTVKNGSKGSKGDNITVSSKTITYQASSSGTTTPTGTWSTTVPSVTKGQYLWTKTYIKLSDNTELTSYSVGYYGKDGTNGTSAVWFTGTAVTGTSTTATSVTVSGSKAGDMYLNTSNGNVYSASAANSWVYKCNIKGAKGDTGAAAGFGTPTATVDANVGTPSVTVTASGSNTAKVFAFAFKNLKGEPGSDATVSYSQSITNASTTIGTITSGSNTYDIKYTPYSHPTSAGNKHIPSGGSSGQFLKYSAAGTAVWYTLTKSDIPALDYVSSTTTRNANTVFAGPSSGNAAAPTFRALVTADLPASGATAGSYGPSANASPAHSGTFSVPYITVNAKGQVTAASTKTITLPASGNTDTKVTQNNSTADSSLRVLLSKSANDTNETNVSYKSNKITFNPSTGLLDIKGKVSISDSSYGCLELYRSGSNYFSGIKFYNDTTASSGTKQLLGSIGMGGDPDTGLWRYNTDGSTKYKILDTENTSFTRTLTSGTKIGSIKINGTSTDIYCETNVDTKNTAGSTNTSSKIFLIGATSQAANPQTYSHDTAYVGTDGCLYSNSTKVSVEGHTHSYLPLAGGTMTGPIKYNSGSKTSTPIVITDGDANGSMMAIGGTGGLTILGAGESANALAALIETEDGFPIPASDSGQFSYTTEHLILSSDTHIYFFTNCNTVANRKAMVLTTGLNLYPDTTNTGNIGTSTYKWAGMYATTFHGALDGNASTATSAGKWTTGITLTIGSTGKSVDGSGNVSWTLAEIGAAASSHTHTKSQITDFPASLKNPNSLTVQGNGTTSFTYDGSAAKTLNIKPGTGISVSSDTSGNITITNTSTNTDTKVTQTNTTTSADYRILLSGNSNDTTETTTVRKSTNFFANPSTGEMFSDIFTSQSSTRHTSLFTSGIKLVTDSTSGSAMGMKYYTSDEATLIGEIGMYTSTNATEIGYAYIGKSYSDKWLNITADNTDFSGSIYVPQRIINKGKSCSTSAGSGAVGYYCIAQFKITGTYFDAPIEVEVSDRGKLSLTTFSIRFANQNSTDPAVSSLRYRGNGLTAYICKSTTSTWQLWVQASGTYSAITIHSIKCSYMSKITVSYPETYLSNDNFTTAIASGGSLATNTKATIGTEYGVGSASQWVTPRVINGMSINGAANRVNYGSCSTAAETAAKTVACTGYALQTGGEITVKFTVANTANNPTLNVNSTGAKAIYYRGAAIPASYLAANRTCTFRYNGTQYELVGDAISSALSTTDIAPVQNKVVTTALQNLSYVLYETNGVDTLISVSNIDTASYDYFTIFIYKLSYLTGVTVAKGTSNVCPIADGHYVSISCPSGVSATVAITRLDGVDVTSSTTSLYIQRIIGHKCVTV